MGVLACDRESCENIMCSRYSSRYGYICHECFDELLATEDMGMREFMETPKKDPLPNPDLPWAEQCAEEFMEND